MTTGPIRSRSWRDVVALNEVARNCGEPLALIPAIKQSNDRHRGWALRRLKDQFGDLRGRIVGVIGLTYKAGTDTLRRSEAVELCRILAAEGCEVRAFDPSARRLPDSLSAVKLSSDAASAIRGADAVVIGANWPEFQALAWAELIRAMRQPCVIDASGFLMAALAGSPNIRYFSVGKPL